MSSCSRYEPPGHRGSGIQPPPNLSHPDRDNHDPTCDFFFLISSPDFPIGAGPTLTPFTLNFTISNLSYVEGMQRPGSREFNRTEKILQRLVGALPTSSSCPAYRGQPRPLNPSPALDPFRSTTPLPLHSYGPCSRVARSAPSTLAAD